MAISLVQSQAASVGSTNASSLAVTTSATGSGNLLVAFVFVQGIASQTITAPSGWSLVSGATTGVLSGNATLGLYYLPNSTSGVTSFTWTFGSSSNAAIAFQEWSGIATSSPLDQYVVQQNAKTTAAPTGTTAALASSGELAVWGLGVSGPVTLTYSSITNSYVQDTSATTHSTESNEAQVALFYNTSVGSAATSSGATMSGTGGTGNTTVLAVFKSGSVTNTWNAPADSVTALDADQLSNIDFTENINFTTDTVSTSDVSTTTLTATAIDTLTASDSSAKTVIFTPTDNITASDAFTKSLAFVATDTVSTSDSLQYVVGNTVSLSDTLTASDTCTDTLAFNPSDTGTTSDTGITTLAYAVTDTLTIGDSIASSIALLGWSTGATQLALDNFDRTVAQGTSFGTATDGQVWNTSTANTIQCAVASNVGTFQAIGANGYAAEILGSTQVQDIELLSQVTLPGASQLTGFAYRMSSNTTLANGYGFYIYSGRVKLNSFVGQSNTLIASVGITITYNVPYWMRVRIVGSFMAFKLWQVGTAEPSSWTLQTVDTTYTGAGYFGYIDSFSSAGSSTVGSLYAVDYALADAVSANDILTVTSGNNTSQMSGTDTVACSESAQETIIIAPVNPMNISESILGIITQTGGDTLPASDSGLATGIIQITELTPITENETTTSVSILQDALTVTETEQGSNIFIPVETLLISELRLFTVQVQSEDDSSILDSIVTSLSGIYAFLETLSITDIFSSALSTQYTEQNVIGDIFASTLTLYDTTALSWTDALIALYNVTYSYSDVLIEQEVLLTQIMMSQQEGITGSDIYSVSSQISLIDIGYVFEGVLSSYSYLYSEILTANEYVQVALAVQEIATLLAQESPAANLLSFVPVEVEDAEETASWAFTFISVENNLLSDALTFLYLIYIALPAETAILTDTFSTTLLTFSVDTQSITDQFSLAFLMTQTEVVTENEQLSTLLSLPFTDTLSAFFDVAVNTLTVFDTSMLNGSDTYFTSLSLVDVYIIIATESSIITTIAVFADVLLVTSDALAGIESFNGVEQGIASEIMQANLLPQISDTGNIPVDTLLNAFSFIPVDTSLLSDAGVTSILLVTGDVLLTQETSTALYAYGQSDTLISVENGVSTLLPIFLDIGSVSPFDVVFTEQQNTLGDSSILSDVLLSIVLLPFTDALYTFETENTIVQPMLFDSVPSIEIITEQIIWSWTEQSNIQDIPAYLQVTSAVEQQIPFEQGNWTDIYLLQEIVNVSESQIWTPLIYQTDNLSSNEQNAFLTALNVTEQGILVDVGMLRISLVQIDTFTAIDSFATTLTSILQEALVSQNFLAAIIATVSIDQLVPSDGPIGIGYQLLADALQIVDNLNYGVELYVILRGILPTGIVQGLLQSGQAGGIVETGHINGILG